MKLCTIIILTVLKSYVIWYETIELLAHRAMLEAVVVTVHVLDSQ